MESPTFVGDNALGKHRRALSLGLNADERRPTKVANLFQGAQDVVITGGIFTVIAGDNNTVIHNAPQEIDLFAVLNPVPATYDCEEVATKVSVCFPGTRQQLLREIGAWSASASAPIFILDGIAGIGKTTVTKSISAAAAMEERLAASFFFSRGHEKRKTTKWIVPTIAYQLARYRSDFRERITAALRENQDILQKDLHTQFITLIKKPLQGLLDEKDPRVVTIDALDECNPEEAVVLLNILFSEIPHLQGLRFFLTCRPERPFRLLLQKFQDLRVFHLHDIEESIVESDIRLYIDDRLSPTAVEKALFELPPPPWQPTNMQKEALVRMAGKLFVVAATSINFILDDRRLAPEQQLRKILETTGKQRISPMDRLYSQVLLSAVPHDVEDADEWFNDYQEVVGSIVTLADVLPSAVLVRLLGIQIHKVIRTLAHLHSLVPPSPDGTTFCVHHKSFPDFVTDPQRCSVDPRLCINPSKRHLRLLECCLRVMDDQLRKNICNLPSEDWHKDLGQLSQDLKDRISPELAYACTHWSFHLGQGSDGLEGDKSIVDLFHPFTTKHLLPWLEVLAFIGRLDVAWPSLKSTSEILDKHFRQLIGPDEDVQETMEIIQDGLRFITLHPNIPAVAPMHIYLSSLPGTPTGTRLFKRYQHCLDGLQVITPTSGADLSWAPSISIQYSGDVQDVAFSPNGTLLATSVLGERGKTQILIWDTESGRLLRELSEPTFWIRNLTFDPSGVHLAAGHGGGGVKIWDVASGTIVSSFESGWQDILTSRNWGNELEDDPQAGDQTDIESTSSPTSPTFPEADSPEPLHSDQDDPDSDSDGDDSDSDVPDSYARAVTALTFSDDGKLAALGDFCGRIFVWRMEQAELEAPLCELTDSDLPDNEATTFDMFTPSPNAIRRLSPIFNGRLAAATSVKVSFWDIRTPNKCTRTRVVDLQDSEDVDGTRSSCSFRNCPVSFTSDGRTLAVARDDSTITVYNVDSSFIAALASHRPRPITAIAFSSQGHQVLSASADGIIRLWDIQSQTLLTDSRYPIILHNAFFSSALHAFILKSCSGYEPNPVHYYNGTCIPFGPLYPLFGEEDERVVPSPDGRLTATQYPAGRTTVICDIPLSFQSTKTVLPALVTSVTGTRVMYPPNGDVVLISSIYGHEDRHSKIVCDTTSNQGVTTSVTVFQEGKNFMHLANHVLSPDTTKMAFIYLDREIYIYNFSEKRTQAILRVSAEDGDKNRDKDKDKDKGEEDVGEVDNETMDEDEDEDEDGDGDENGNGNEVISRSLADRSICFSQDGQLLALLSGNMVYVWVISRNVMTSREGNEQASILPSVKVGIPRRLVGPKDHPNIVFAASNRLLVASLNQIWELQYDTIPWRQTRIGVPTYSDYPGLMVSQDGSKLFTMVVKSNSINVWSLSSLLLAGTLSDPSHPGYSYLYSIPDFPETLVSWSTHGLTVWDLKSYQKLGEFIPISMRIQTYHAYSPTSHLILARRDQPPSLGLLFVQTMPGRPTEVRVLSWFPPHMEIDLNMTASRTSPVVAFWGDRKARWFDLSKFNLPI